MLNNIGLPGIVLLLIIVVLPIWLIVSLMMRSSKRKATEQKRIADALEAIAQSKKNEKPS
jgi:preprotein translocase subunit YajC